MSAAIAVPEADTLPDGYRMTELGPLPEEWEVVWLGEVAEIKYGKAKPKAEGTVPVIGSGGIYGWANSALVKFPTLVIGRKGTAGQVWLLEQPCWPSDTTYYLVWKRPIDVRFVFGFLTLNPLSGEHAKTTLPSLQRPDLENYLIPLPPLVEQRAIAHVLRTVQEAREATERVVAALRELKKSLMRHLFTYGPRGFTTENTENTEKNSVNSVRSVVNLKDTEIGPIPEHWQVVRLGEVVERTTQIDPQRIPGWEFKYVDVSSVDNESLRIVDYQICLGKDAPSRARKVIRSGDVIFATVRPSLKRIAIVQPEFDGQVCSTAFCVLRPNPTLIDGSFLFCAVLRDQFVASVSENQRGSSYPAVTDNDVKRALIPLPPLAEQREIARILQAVDRRIAAEEAYARALGDLFKTLLHELMTARRRVPPAVVDAFAVATP